MILEQTDESDFVKELSKITVFFIYIDENNEVYSIKSCDEALDENCFNKERQLYIIKEAQYNLQKKHKLTSLCYFNIDIEQEKIQDLIDEKLKNTFFHTLDILDSIKFNKTLKFLHDHASVFYVFKYLSSSPHNTTKRVIIRDSKRTTRKHKPEMHIKK
jgi:hypothetical protein